MDNGFQTQKQNNSMMIAIMSAALLWTSFFAIYSFRERSITDITQKRLKEDNSKLLRQIEMIESKNPEKEEPIFNFNTAQIYHSITENANQYQIRIKGFTPERDKHNLLITLIGTYPKAIGFFGKLYQDKLGVLKKIEIKKYAEEPTASVEILVTLTTAPKGGVSR